MARRITLAPLSIRLLTSPPPLDAAMRSVLPRVYRPLTVGPAILERARGAGGPWRVQLAKGHPLLPLSPCSTRALSTHLLQLHGRGVVTRLAAAIVTPNDVARRGGDLAGVLRHRGRRAAGSTFESYGWALMYRLDTTGPYGLVDPHDEHPELPACYESPQELVDRVEFLAAKGVATRPLAIITEPQDFDIAADRPPRNRYCDAAVWQRACLPGILVGD
jgi:hypothetical protein